MSRLIYISSYAGGSGASTFKVGVRGGRGRRPSWWRVKERSNTAVSRALACGFLVGGVGGGY